MITTLIILFAIFNIIIYGLIVWAGINRQESELTQFSARIAIIIGLICIALQIFLVNHHLILI